MRIAFIDHYDSFSFNVLDWLQRAADFKFEVLRITCDDETGLARLKKNPIPTVISPGPGVPSNYPHTMNLISHLIGKSPIFGICLGHQMIGQIAGFSIKKAINPWHGTLETINVHRQNWFTAGIPDHFQAIVYNSLIVAADKNENASWIGLGFDKESQLMMMSHRDFPVASVQFHPESFASQNLENLARNFLNIALHR